MKNIMSLYSLIITAIVAIYLVLVFVNPISSLLALVSAVLLSVIGIVCAAKGIRYEKTALSIIAVITGGLVTGLMLIVFLIMLIMGM